MKKLTIILLSLIAHLAHSQESKPVSTFSHINLTGMVDLQAEGVIFVSKGSKNKQVALTLIDTGGHYLWTREIKYDKNKGKTAGKVWILADDKLIYWIHLSNKQIKVALLNSYDGSVFQEETTVFAWKETALDPMPTIIDRRLILMRPISEGIELIKIKPKSKDSIQTVTLSASTLEGQQALMQPIGYKNNRVLAYNYLTNKNHSEINLRIFEFDLKGDLTNEKIHTFQSERNAFAPLALQDKRLFYIAPSITGWYIMGKLDFGTSGKYVANSATEGCHGFWIAKLDQALKVSYFSEQPFIHCMDAINNGLIRKAIFFDFKEDENQHVFVHLAEIPDVVSHKSYLFEFNKIGGFEYLISGLSEFNFFDYNKFGTRNTHKSSALRLVNDDWRYYATNFLDDVKLKEKRHGEILKFIAYQSEHNKQTKQEQAYNFTITSKQRALVYEYLDARRRTLNIYKIKID